MVAAEFREFRVMALGGGDGGGGGGTAAAAGFPEAEPT